MDRPQKTIAHGFTLVELLIAMAIGLIVLTSVSSAFITQRKAYNLEEQKTEMIQTARAAMDMISSEVKMAGYRWNPTPTTPSSLQTTDSSVTSTYVGISYDPATAKTQLNILADIGGGDSDGVDNDGDGSTDEADEADFSDGAIDDSNEDITYAYDSTNEQITRDTGGGAQPLAENIEDFSFKYFGHNYDSATESVVDDEIINSAEQERIRVIEITIIAKTADPDPDYTHPTNGDGYRTYTLTSYITPPNLRN